MSHEPDEHPGLPPAAVVGAVLAHPDLWPTAVRQLRILARPGWWRSAPFLPLPDPAYLRFRVLTANGGDGSGDMAADDVLSYLRWCHDSRA